MRGTIGSVLHPGVPRHEVSRQVPTLDPPTESETDQNRPSPTLLHGSNSLVSGTLNHQSLPTDVPNYMACVCLNKTRSRPTSVVCLVSGNTSPRAISRAERERKVSMRLHRGAPANVSSSDLTARHDQSRISTSQVRTYSKHIGRFRCSKFTVRARESGHAYKSHAVSP